MTAKEIVGRYPVLGSSANPEELSLTIKGLIIGIIPVAIYIADKYGWGLDQVQVVAFVDTLFTLVAEAVILVGMARKVFEMGKALLVKK